MADCKIVEGDEGDEKRVGGFIDAHAEALGVELVSGITFLVPESANGIWMRVGSF